jgi:hypothetical protein
MLTLDQLATFEHCASTGILLAADQDAPQSNGLWVIAVAAAVVAVITGRTLARLLTVIVEAWRLALEAAQMALRLATLLAGVLLVLGISVMQLLPI